MGKKLTVVQKIRRSARMWAKKHPELVKRERALMKRRNTIRRKKIEAEGGIDAWIKRSAFHDMDLGNQCDCDCHC